MKYVLKYLTLFRSSQFNVSAARQLGYPAPLIVMYHSGMLTDSLYSWVGLNANATLNGTIEQLYDARLEKISFEGATPEQVSERFFLPYSYCKVLKARPYSILGIIIENVIDDYYFIFVSDVAAVTNFQLPVYLLTGQKLYLHMKSEKPKIEHYNIKLKEISDQTGKEDACTWYPNDAFDNYADCIDVEMREKIMPVLGCMVPWMSSQDPCEGTRKMGPVHKQLLSWVSTLIKDSFGGIQYKSRRCLKPCSLLSAHAVHRLSRYLGYRDNTGTKYRGLLIKSVFFSFALRDCLQFYKLSV